MTKGNGLESVLDMLAGKMVFMETLEEAAEETTKAACEKFGLEFKGRESMLELNEVHGVEFRSVSWDNKKGAEDRLVITCNEGMTEVYMAQLVEWNAVDGNVERSTVEMDEESLKELRKELEATEGDKQ
jgi:hypothetical protein